MKKKLIIIGSIFLALVIVAISVFGIVSCNRRKKYEYKYTETEKYYFFENYSYADRKERSVFDLALPKHLEGSSGLVLNIHGGGWVAGSKDGLIPREYYITDSETLKNTTYNDYAYGALNYRYISEDSDCEDILEDISSVLVLMKKLAKEKGIDLDRVLLTGGSAGAHLALQYGYQCANISPIEVVAVSSLSGPTDMLDENYWDKNGAFGRFYDDYCDWFPWLSGIEFTAEERFDYAPFIKKVSPLYYVNENTVPTIIAHGRNDEIVPYSNAVSLDEKLTEHGVPHHFFTYENSGHGLENDQNANVQYTATYNEYVQTYLVNG